MGRRKESTFPFSDELIDELLEGREHGAHLLGNEGLVGELKKRKRPSIAVCRSLSR